MRIATLLAAASLLAAINASSLRAQDEAPRVIQKFTGDLGFVQTSGNTQVTTTNVGERYTAESGRFMVTQAFALIYGKQRDTVNTNNLRTSLRLDYKVDRVFSRRPQTRSAWKEAAA